MSSMPAHDLTEKDGPQVQKAIGFSPRQLAYLEALAAAQHEGTLSRAVRQLVDLGMAAHAAQTPSKT